MKQTKSRFFNLMKAKKPVMDGNKPRNGIQFVIFYNKFGYTKINCILNWQDGFLNSSYNIPAVQMEDGHTEYWENGVLSNTQLDIEGNQMPAVFSDGGEIKEYWVNGKRIK